MSEEAPIDVTTDPRLAELAELSDLLASVPRLEEKRKRLMRELKVDGYTAEQLMAAASVSKQRIYQILDGTGTRKRGARHDHDTGSPGSNGAH